MTGTNRVGGVIGWMSNGCKVYNCQNNGTVTGTTRCAGGIVGDIYSDSTVINCANLADVDGKELVGGITGGSTRGTITNCSNAGKVTGTLRYGAIAGDNASYAGKRSYTYFRKTNIVNAIYSIIGENSRTYSSSSGSLNEAVVIYNKSYTTASKALNAWVSANKTPSVRYLSWKLVNNKPELNFNSYTLNISNSNLKLDLGKSEAINYSIKDAKGNVVNKTVKFSSSKKSVAKVSSKGKVVAVGAGVCKITCKVDETSKTVTVTVPPKKVTSITVSKKTKNSLVLKWKKQTGVSGYDIYMYDTDIKEYTKVKSVKGSANSATIPRLKKGTTYKFKIKAYVKSGSKKYYGKVSSVYKTKTKK